MTGRLIVVEGLEGAGKSTAISTVLDCLNAHALDVITTREPGGTRVGEVARTLIKESIPDEPLDARAELLLLYASRVQLLEQVILPALRRGCWVVADRFELSTWAYQGGGRKLDTQVIAMLSSFCLQDFTPDLILFLDISPELGLERARLRGKVDRMEQESLPFFKDVYAAYHERIGQMKHVVSIDASQSLVKVQETIQSIMADYLRE